jgi:hypothetical protein
MGDLPAFTTALEDSPAGPVFNPWYELDPDHDRTDEAPAIRRRQLTSYLGSRLGSARWLLVGEALGYNGGHFSGLAMTSERILLGHQRDRGVHPSDVLPDVAPARTSRVELKPKGFTEPTATVVWGAMNRLGVPADTFVLWNAFPWHPYEPDRGRLSNRRPTRAEMRAAVPQLRRFLSLFPNAGLLAVGAVAAEALADHDRPFWQLRHPSFGGANAFRDGLSQLLVAG